MYSVCASMSMLQLVYYDDRSIIALAFKIKRLKTYGLMVEIDGKKDLICDFLKM